MLQKNNCIKEQDYSKNSLHKHILCVCAIPWKKYPKHTHLGCFSGLVLNYKHKSRPHILLKLSGNQADVSKIKLIYD